MFDRKAHCRRIASMGGKATYAKHGSAHFSALGVRGFHATAKRFGSVTRYKNYLSQIGAEEGRRQTLLPDTGKFKSQIWAPWNKPDVPF